MICFLGDIHGDYNAILTVVKKYGLSDCTIFQCGDFGIGWETRAKEESRLKYLNTNLKNKNITLNVLRGNHDDPSYFDGLSKGVSNINLLKDYTVVEVDDERVLCIGGAVSLDRYGRRAYWGKGKIGWWKDEEVVDRLDLVREMEGISVVATHTTPEFLPTMHSSMAYTYIDRDKNLRADIAREKKLLADVYEELVTSGKNCLRLWFCGHMHRSASLIYGGTNFSILNIKEIAECYTDDK